jgi:hypothetical protein
MAFEKCQLEINRSISRRIVLAKGKGRIQVCNAREGKFVVRNRAYDIWPAGRVEEEPISRESCPCEVVRSCG